MKTLYLVFALALPLTIAGTAVGGTQSYSTTNTSNATTNTATINLGWFTAGTTVRLGTCNPSGALLTSAQFTSDTFLRVDYFDAAGGWREVRAVDDSCGGNGSFASYSLPRAGALRVRAGCWSTTSCSGTVQWEWDHDTNGRLGNVLDAWLRFSNLAGTRMGFAKGSIFAEPGAHLQGFSRLRFTGPNMMGENANWMALSDAIGNLYFLGFNHPDQHYRASYPDNLDSNGAAPSSPSTDKMYNLLAMEDSFGAHLHLGGMQTSGRFLLVPSEQSGNSTCDSMNPLGCSRVFIVNTDPPWSPQVVNQWGYPLQRRACAQNESDPSECGYAAFAGIAKYGQWDSVESHTRFDKFLLVVGDRDTDSLDFYRKQPGNDGWANLWDNSGAQAFADWFAWTFNTSGCPTGRCADGYASGLVTNANWGVYQHMSLIVEHNSVVADVQSNPSRVYLVGTEATNDRADIFEVTSDDFNSGDKPGGCTKTVCLLKVGSLSFDCSGTTNPVRDRCSFEGAAGAYFNPDDGGEQDGLGTLSLYSSEFSFPSSPIGFVWFKQFQSDYY